MENEKLTGIFDCYKAPIFYVIDLQKVQEEAGQILERELTQKELEDLYVSMCGSNIFYIGVSEAVRGAIQELVDNTNKNKE